MNKTLIKQHLAVGAFAFGISIPALAQAQSLGERHDLVIGVERVFGMYTTHIEAELPNGQNSVQRGTGVGLGYQRPVTALTVPRVAVDYFISPSLSLGGSLGFDAIDPDTGDPNDSGAFLFSPRVGYAIPFNPDWGVWFHGGLTYLGEDFGNNVNTSLLALTADATFYYMPAPSVGFTGGPILDLGITGSRKAGNFDGDYNERLFGLGFGMFARL